MKKTMKKSMKNMLSMAAAVLTATIMTACAGSDELADTPQQPENQNRVITLTTTVGLGGGAADAGDEASGASAGTTRALTSGGVKTFAVGETMALVYENMSNKRTVKESEPLTAGDIAEGGKSATFTFRLTEEPNKNSSVKYIYPAAMLKANGSINYEALFTEQDGTLAKLASNFDFATANDLDWVNGNLPGAELTNQLAILAITLKDNATGDDITGSITGLTLTARNNSHTESMTYNITRSAAPGPIYVAIFPTKDLEFEVTATGGTNIYVKTLTDKTYEINNGYNVSWKMTNATPLSNTTPLTMEVTSENGGTIVVNNPRSGMKYSKNGGEKTAVTSDAISVSAGDKVQFYGNGTSITCYDGTSIAGGSAEVKVYGNIMSLVNETGFATATTLTVANTFACLFEGNTNLTDASGLLLPATKLANGCYAAMFKNCTCLTTAPALPATTLVQNCYCFMFSGCSSLTTAPALPATTLANSCYSNMFEGCTKLSAAPELPATTLAQYCYFAMFSGCTKLSAAPALPATKLAEGCYLGMFDGCTKLSSVTCLATDISADWCTEDWLYNAGTQVTGTKTFTTPSSTNWPSGNSGIPSGWTRLNPDGSPYAQ